MVQRVYEVTGCIAEDEQGHKRSDPDSNLYGNAEETRHESDLSPDIAFAYPFESTLITRGDKRDAALSILRNLNGLDLIRADPSDNGIGPIYQH
jgi:hypothetical protein